MSFAVELFDFLMTADFTDAVTYERLTETVDVTSLSDMVLTHLYAGNWDFAYNNIKMWRTGTVDESNPYVGAETIILMRSGGRIRRAWTSAYRASVHEGLFGLLRTGSPDVRERRLFRAADRSRVVAV